MFFGPKLHRNGVIMGHTQNGKRFFGRNNKSRSSAFRKFLFYQNIICFDWVLNLFYLEWCFLSSLTWLDFNQSINQNKYISLPNNKNTSIVITVFQWISIYTAAINCHINYVHLKSHKSTYTCTTLPSSLITIFTYIYITTTKLCRKI